MHKKHLLSLTAVSLAAMVSASAGAASVEEVEVLLRASVPADNFHVRPVESGWIGERQEMVYDLSTEKLQPFKKMFQYKNTAGAIKATLLNTGSDGAPQLFNGNNSNSIPLAVKFNNIAVTEQGVQVVTADEAKNGGRTNLNISTVNNSALDPATYAGDYTGNVFINFEPVVASE
ncbi:CS1 type fimbrial major subunit [Enterobacter bugandensis]|uniref:CS1 type fimbrial major subunit n=1 Tax=Enterobacter bugandensis TaxID=881260 RepID=UPI0021CE32EF|nr:CS1 type fimbrial major subunit [Enterobacter bugandensis]MCU6172418.1 adhesin [Enterobacter bugandensis]